MAFTSDLCRYTALSLTMATACLVLVQTHAQESASLTIADDLPKLSVNSTIKELCSSGHYVSVADKYVLQYDASKEEPAWIRAQLRVFGAKPSGEWGFKITDRSGRIVESIDGGSRFRDGDTAWTKVIEGPTVSVTFRSAGPAEGFKVCLTSVNIAKSSPTITSIINEKDDREDLVGRYTTSSPYYRYGLPIALLRFQEIVNSDGDDTSCTAFAVSSTLILTNNHCISSNKQIPTTTVTFKWDTGEVSPVEIAANALEYTNSALDYSVIRLSRPTADIVKVDLGEVAPSQRLILIQHPSAERKRISVKKCKVQTQKAPGRDTDFFHLCDSSGGSSGSPVMDEHTGRVFGIHHLGVTDPRRQDYHNLAVYMSEAVCDLKKNREPIFSEILMAQGISEQDINCPRSATGDEKKHVSAAAMYNDQLMGGPKGVAHYATFDAFYSVDESEEY